MISGPLKRWARCAHRDAVHDEALRPSYDRPCQRHCAPLAPPLLCSALSEHLEPLYLENLRAAIAKMGKHGS